MKWQPFRFVWQPDDLFALNDAVQYIFLRYCPPSTQAIRTLDENNFLEIFPKLKEVRVSPWLGDDLTFGHFLQLNLDSHTRDAIFRVFDVTGRGTIDFRDFCRGLSM